MSKCIIFYITIGTKRVKYNKTSNKLIPKSSFDRIARASFKRFLQTHEGEKFLKNYFQNCGNHMNVLDLINSFPLSTQKKHLIKMLNTEPGEKLCQTHYEKGDETVLMGRIESFPISIQKKHFIKMLNTEPGEKLCQKHYEKGKGTDLMGQIESFPISIKKKHFIKMLNTKPGEKLCQKHYENYEEEKMLIQI